MMNIQETLKYIVDSEMDLDELILERLDMTHEDLVYDLIGRIKERLPYFQDIERHEL